MSIEFEAESLDRHFRVETDYRKDQAIGGRKMREAKENAVEDGVIGNNRSETEGDR
jgi:hypothetical protein